MSVWGPDDCITGVSHCVQEQPWQQFSEWQQQRRNSRHKTCVSTRRTAAAQISVTASNVWCHTPLGPVLVWTDNPLILLAPDNWEWECVTLDLYLCRLYPLCVPSQPSDAICNRHLRWSSPALTPSHITLIQTRLKEPGSWGKIHWLYAQQKVTMIRGSAQMMSNQI